MSMCSKTMTIKIFCGRCRAITPDSYLSLVQKLNTLIENKTLEREELFTRATKTTQVLNDMPKGSSREGMPDLVIRMYEKASEKVRLIDLLFRLKEEVLTELELLPIEEYAVLYDYYILNKSLSEIADTKNRSVSWVKAKRKHGLCMVEVNESKTLQDVLKLFPRLS